jgi:hypothetical protein
MTVSVSTIGLGRIKDSVESKVTEAFFLCPSEQRRLFCQNSGSELLGPASTFLRNGYPMATSFPQNSSSSSSAFSLYPGGNAYVTAFDFPPFMWPHSVFEEALRIQYKVLALAYQCFNATAPKYLCEIVQAYQPSRPLRSASHSRLQIPSSSECRKKRSGFRAFSNAASSLWNDLPLQLRESDSLLPFRRSLKTHLFSQL